MKRNPSLPLPPCPSETEFGALRQDKRAGMPPAALQSWRARLGQCLGLDVHTPAAVQGKTILIVDRPYEAGGAREVGWGRGRAMWGLGGAGKVRECLQMGQGG